MRGELSALTSRFERYKKLAKNCLTGVGKARPTTARATSRRSWPNKEIAGAPRMKGTENVAACEDPVQFK
jgi:hypothetical protein